MVDFAAHLIPQRAREDAPNLTGILVLRVVNARAKGSLPGIRTSASSASKKDKLPWPVIWFVNCFCARLESVAVCKVELCAAYLAVEVQSGAC